MSEPLAVTALARSVGHDFVRVWRMLLLYEVLFKLVEAWLLLPAVARVLTATDMPRVDQRV